MLYQSGRFEEARYLFRGVRDASWRLVSSFDRFADSLPLSERPVVADRLLQLFAEECARDNSVEEAPAGADERIGAAQHHGLPTRGLDWTHSPYVAAFFAFEQLDFETETNGDVAIWALDRKHPAWQVELGAEILLPRSRTNDRMARQRGALTYLRAPFADLEAYVEQIGPPGPALIKCRLPRREWPLALADLNAMGISAEQLFPGWDGAARGALMRWALR
jgi:hypothetical protein